MADRSIMLVDDNDINRGILAEIFKDKYNIIEASDGSEAVRLINQESSKLAAVLLDVIMPGMDGYAVLEAMVKQDNLMRGFLFL